MEKNKLRPELKIGLFNNSGYSEGENNDEIKDLW